MPKQPEDENIPRYQRGVEWFQYIVDKQMANRPWQRLGIISFYDAPFVASEKLYLSPKQVMVVMARQAKTKDTGLVFVADALEKAEMGLSTKKGFDQFMHVFDSLFPDAEKFYFGPKDSDRTFLHEYPTLKIPLQWLIKRPNKFAEVLSDASPVGEDIGPGDAAFEDLAGMKEVLVEKLGPPSLTEEVLGKIKSTEASEYAGEAVGLMTVFISPASAVTRGVRYLGKFASLIKERRKQEVKEVYQEWEERVNKAYSEENLLKFFDTDPNSDYVLSRAVSERKPVLIITETRGTLYDLFLPLVLQHLVEEIGYLLPHLRPRMKGEEKKTKSKGTEEKTGEAQVDISQLTEADLPPVTGTLVKQVFESHESEGGQEDATEEFEGKPRVILCLDAATHLSKFRRSFRFALNLPEKYPNVSVAASFFTDRETISSTLQDGILDYMSERAIVFDLHPMMFDLATAKIPITKKAWLQGRLQEMERIHTEGGVAFLEFYKHARQQWTLRIVEEPDRGAIETIRRWFKR